MESSIRLLCLRKKMTTFKNIATRVEALTKRKLLYTHLAQMKHLFPEAIQIIEGDKENFIKYGNHAFTYRIVDRIFSEVPRKFTSKVEGEMGYEDFVHFILSEEDKSS